MTKKLFSRFLSDCNQACSQRMAEASRLEWPGVARHFSYHCPEGGHHKIPCDWVLKEEQESLELMSWDIGKRPVTGTTIAAERRTNELVLWLLTFSLENGLLLKDLVCGEVNS